MSIDFDHHAAREALTSGAALLQAVMSRAWDGHAPERLRGHFNELAELQATAIGVAGAAGPYLGMASALVGLTAIDDLGPARPVMATMRKCGCARTGPNAVPPPTASSQR